MLNITNRLIRVFALLLAFMLLCSVPALASGTDEDEDFVLFPVTPAPATPDPAATPDLTVIPTAAPKSDSRVEYLPDGSQYFTVTAIGDVTMGKSLGTTKMTLFSKELKLQGNDPAFIFKNVRDIFEEDDLTIVNFECVMQEEGKQKIPSNKKNNQFLFLAEPSYVRALTENSVEAVALENNHIMDFGESGRDSTIDVLTRAGVVYSNHTTMGTFEKDGVRVAMFSHQTLNQPFTSEELAVTVAQEIAAVRDDYDIIIVSYHWGNEKDYWPVDKQVRLAHATIDAGADLVLGHHSHRINPIEYYNGKYIVYSLGNGSFAGHNKPSDMSTFIFQERFRVKDGVILSSSFRIIPARISSRTDYNNFMLTPYDKQQNIDTVINNLKSNGKRLKYAVTDYPLEFE
ncbi:MAG: hypothetical protein CW338_08355 [Clostridiales bacterium]|nr:hypothetical protein [Clostridiales bacterium]